MLTQFLTVSSALAPNSQKNRSSSKDQALSQETVNRAHIIEKEAIKKLSELINISNAHRTQIVYYCEGGTDNTIIMLAAQANCIIGMEWLSYQPEFSSLIGRKNRANQTALFLALLNQHLYMVNILTAAGETYQSIAGYRHPVTQDTFLTYAAKKELLSSQKMTYLLKIPGLIQTIDSRDQKGYTAVCLLVVKGNWPAALFLLKKGASHASLSNFLSPVATLAIAARNGSLEAFEHLLQLPVFKEAINIPTRKKISVILVAALARHWAIVEYLQACGADTTPLIDYREEKTENDILMLTAEKGSKRDLEILFKIPHWERLIGRTNFFHHTALFIASVHGNQPAVEAIIEKKAGNIQQEVIDFRYNGHYTPLMQAVNNRCVRGVQYLVTIPQIRQEIDHENQTGETALIQATFQKKK